MPGGRYGGREKRGKTQRKIGTSWKIYGKHRQNGKEKENKLIISYIPMQLVSIPVSHFLIGKHTVRFFRSMVFAIQPHENVVTFTSEHLILTFESLFTKMSSDFQ